MRKTAPAMMSLALFGLSCGSPARQRAPVPPPVVAAPFADTSTSGLPPDNSLCLICHINFAENDTIADHISRRVSCAYCHGASEDHMNDESMMTPPDILYGRKEIEELCGRCHSKTHKQPDAVKAFIVKWGGEKRENGRNVTARSICTDCHGRHTISRR